MCRTTADLLTTTVIGDSSHLMKRVEQLYLRPGMTIADVTAGLLVFWRKIDLRQYTFLPTDLIPQSPEIKPYDCRHLPYGDGTIDVVVLDPPFISRAFPKYNRLYQLDAFALTPEEVFLLYRAAMKEAKRVLKDDGLLMVKCKDGTSGGRPCRTSIELFQYATRWLNLKDEDRFVLVRRSPPPMIPNVNKRQHHAINTESYLWVFRK